VQEAMREKGKIPMSKDREKTPKCNRAADSQNAAEPSITDLSFTTMVE